MASYTKQEMMKAFDAGAKFGGSKFASDTGKRMDAFNATMEEIDRARPSKKSGDDKGQTNFADAIERK